MYPKLSRVVTLMRESNPQSHVTHQPLGHETTQRRSISTFIRPMYLAKLAGYWLFCGYYDRGFRRRKLADPSISLCLSFFVKKKHNLSNVKEAVGTKWKTCAYQK